MASVILRRLFSICKHQLNHYTKYMKIYQRFLFAAVVTGFSILLTLYTSYWLQTLFPQWSEIFVFYEYSAVIVLVAAFILLQAIRKPHPIYSKRQNYAVNMIFILVLSQVIYSAFLLVGDIITTVFNIDSLLVNKLWVVATTAFLIACIYGAIWGKYRYTVRKEILYFDDLPDAFHGFTIAQISDVHSWSFTDADRVQAGIHLINKQQPDLFVFTGDLVNNHAAEFDTWKDIFAQIKAPHGQYSILGNHDYGDYAAWNTDEEKHANLEQLKQHHADIGWHLLLNEHTFIEKDGQKIKLAWVENRWHGFVQHGDLDKAIVCNNNECFTVLLSHDPTHWVEKVQHHKQHVHITLSWHTHGMQMGFDFTSFKRSPIKYRYKKWIGLYETNGRYLYINRGFGFLWLSARVGIWPEITIITLKKK